MVTLLRHISDDPSRKATGISQTQAYILKSLRRSGQARAVDLARSIGLTPGALTSVLDELEERSLISRERSRDDRRVVWIRPTPDGLALCEQIGASRRAEWVQFLQFLGAEDTAQLLRILGRAQEFMTLPKGEEIHHG